MIRNAFLSVLLWPLVAWCCSMKNDTSDVKSVPKTSGTSGTSGTSFGIAITWLIHQKLKNMVCFGKFNINANW